MTAKLGENMKYNHVIQGRFLSRPNRFIAKVEINGEEHTVHVKNTGRCKELLVEGATVYLEKGDNPNRKTQYDLIAVRKGDLLVNMDSQAPNRIFAEWAKTNISDLVLIKSEITYGDSRFDFYLETKTERIFVEVKGVTLERDGVLMFPDAPTQRGLKHLRGLVQCLRDGYRAMVVFIVQMERAEYFCANCETHPEFAEELKRAKEAGVRILALKCSVTPEKIVATDEIQTKI